MFFVARTDSGLAAIDDLRGHRGIDAVATDRAGKAEEGTGPGAGAGHVRSL